MEWPKNDPNIVNKYKLALTTLLITQLLLRTAMGFLLVISVHLLHPSLYGTPKIAQYIKPYWFICDMSSIKPKIFFMNTTKPESFLLPFLLLSPFILFFSAFIMSIKNLITLAKGRIITANAAEPNDFVMAHLIDFIAGFFGIYFVSLRKYQDAV